MFIRFSDLATSGTRLLILVSFTYALELRSFDSDLTRILKSAGSETVFDVMRDPRTVNWMSTVPEDFLHSTPPQLLSIRAPLLRIVTCVDLSRPTDVDMVRMLLSSPTPSDIFLQPIHVEGSRANNILTRCYDSIIRSPSGGLDAERLNDFLYSLFQLSKPGSDASISDAAAVLVCKLYTQRFDEVCAWLDTPDWEPYVPDVQKLYSLSPSSLVINDNVYLAHSPEEIASALVYSQNMILSKHLDVKDDEL